MKKLSLIGLAIAALLIPINAKAQKYGATPEDSVKCVENLAMYREFVKADDHLSAYGPWKEVINTCPRSSENAYIQTVTFSV